MSQSMLYNRLSQLRSFRTCKSLYLNKIRKYKVTQQILELVRFPSKNTSTDQ